MEQPAIGRFGRDDTTAAIIRDQSGQNRLQVNAFGQTGGQFGFGERLCSRKQQRFGDPASFDKGHVCIRCLVGCAERLIVRCARFVIVVGGKFDDLCQIAHAAAPCSVDCSGVISMAFSERFRTNKGAKARS